jgi:N-acetylneuraminic acid mutarotase
MRAALRSLVIPVVILLLPACRDETAPLQPNTPIDPSPALMAVGNSWAVKAPMPTSRIFHSAGVANDANGQPTLYVFGGTDGEVEGFSTVEAYDPATNNWTTQPPSQMVVDEVRFFNGVGRIGNELYLPGGDKETGNGNARLTVLQVYDPVRNTWTRKADMPRGSSDGVSGVIDGKLYVLHATELIDVECEECGTRPTRRLFRYDPVTDTWAKLAWCPNFHRFGMAGVIDGKFYVAGGHNAADDSADKLDIYDPATNRWSSGRPLPSPRSGGSAAVLGGKLYVIGGFTGEFGGEDRTDEVLAYNPKTNRWTTKTPLPTVRAWMAAAKVLIAGQAHIVAVGGQASVGQDFFPETFVYTP